jgi:hypothetical protein
MEGPQDPNRYNQVQSIRTATNMNIFLDDMSAKPTLITPGDPHKHQKEMYHHRSLSNPASYQIWNMLSFH